MSGLSSAQLANLLKSTTFQNATPAMQGRLLEIMREANGKVAANGGVDPFETSSSGSSALGSGSASVAAGAASITLSGSGADTSAVTGAAGLIS